NGELGRGATAPLPGSLYLHARPPDADPRRDRRLQVLPSRGARGDRAGGDRRRGLRLPDRDDLPRATEGIPRRRGADPLCRPDRGPVEDEPGDRARGDLEGAAAATAGAYAPRLVAARAAYICTTAACWKS